MGGIHFDTLIVNHFLDEIKGKHNQDLKKDSRALQRLRTACEEAKRTLSTSEKAFIQLDPLFEDETDFCSSITRNCFEELNSNMCLKILKCVEKCLRDAKMDKGDIDEVLLVGGSTRIPKIQEMLKHLFNGKTFNKSIHPDEGVAYGAAVQAAILHGVESQLRDVLLQDLDWTPMSSGIETVGENKTPKGIIYQHNNKEYDVIKSMSNKVDDVNCKGRIKARKALETCCFNIKDKVNNGNVKGKRIGSNHLLIGLAKAWYLLLQSKCAKGF